MKEIKLEGKYIERDDVKSPYCEVQNVKILDDELKSGFYLIDTGCDFDVVISEVFVSPNIKRLLFTSKNCRIERNPDGIVSDIITNGLLILSANYSKKVLVDITYDNHFLGEKIIGIGVINDFLTTLDPFKDKINLTRLTSS